jgi:hypothetical protein
LESNSRAFAVCAGIPARGVDERRARRARSGIGRARLLDRDLSWAEDTGVDFGAQAPWRPPNARRARRSQRRAAPAGQRTSANTTSTSTTGNRRPRRIRVEYGTVVVADQTLAAVVDEDKPQRSGFSMRRTRQFAPSGLGLQHARRGASSPTRPQQWRPTNRAAATLAFAAIHTAASPYAPANILSPDSCHW